MVNYLKEVEDTLRERVFKTSISRKSVPFEIIQGIIKCMLPENVPQTTVNLYRDNFFFNSIQNQSPIYEEDSQEECNIGSDADRACNKFCVTAYLLR